MICDNGLMRELMPLGNKGSQRIKEKVNERLKLLEKKENKYKDSFVILLLYPAYPPEEKKRILRLKRKLVARKWQNVFLMEDFNTGVNLSDRFDFLLGEAGLSPDLIAAIFTQKGTKEGASWELGFLWGSALVTARSSINKDNYQRFISRIVIYTEKGVSKDGVCTKMLTNGAFKKIVTFTFENDNELLDLIESTAKRLLDYKHCLLGK